MEGRGVALSSKRQEVERAPKIMKIRQDFKGTESRPLGVGADVVLFSDGTTQRWRLNDPESSRNH